MFSTAGADRSPPQQGLPGLPVTVRGEGPVPAEEGGLWHAAAAV